LADSFDDASTVAVLANCRRAMRRNGHLPVIEPVLCDRIAAATDPTIPADMLMDLNMLVRTGARERTTAEYRAVLAAADLRLERVVASGAEVSLLVAAPA
jgi:hypothetical protein